MLYFIFWNLIDNVIVYVGIYIFIIICCFCEDECFYYFSFLDIGVGVGFEYLSCLFECFYWVDKGCLCKLGGIGLGLVIVKNVVILYGGIIFVKNIFGGGLEFIFILSKE